jgi:hypothetical protein
MAKMIQWPQAINSLDSSGIDSLEHEISWRGDGGVSLLRNCAEREPVESTYGFRGRPTGEELL